MSASLGVSSYSPSRDRILNRAVLASPGKPSPMAVPQYASPLFLEQQRCSSLPRHFARGGFVSSPHGQLHGSSQFRPPPTFPPQPMFLQPQPVSADPFDQSIDDEEGDNLSQDCNKSDASRRSLESELPSGWNSVPDSVNTTANLSPVSPADLPDSPTHYTAMKQAEEHLRAQGLLASFSDHGTSLGMIPPGPLMINGPKNSNGSDLSKNGGSDAATAVVEDFPTPTFPPYGAGHHLGRQINGNSCTCHE